MNIDQLCYYVVAHQDDWQLFYGQQAYADLRMPNNRVVFIYTTAGDAGQSEAWWRAREQGALAAQALAGGSTSTIESGTAMINGHRVATYENGAFVSYHLRLPDGNVNGAGFESTGNVSLEKLQIGCIPKITAVDDSTAYHGWEDFCATVGAIIDRELRPASVVNPWVNAADWSWNCSPRDHSDHKATANALRNVFCNRDCIFNRLWFVTYSTDERHANLSGEALQQKESVWLAYRQKVEALVDAEFLAREWAMWGARSYYRRVMAGEEDAGECG